MYFVSLTSHDFLNTNQIVMKMDRYNYTCVDFGGSSSVCNGDVTFSSRDGDSVGS